VQRGTSVLVLTAGRVLVHPAAVRAVKLAAVSIFKSFGEILAQVFDGEFVRLLVERGV
jgi:hypothetical protein